MAYDLRTRNGHNMYDISSMLQKAIRRGDIERAGYSAMELFGSFHTYLWKRLITISAEDCYGIMTKEIIALKFADDEVNKGRKGYDRDYLFVAKAITLLCMARKNRDGCYVACNFMYPDKCLAPEEIEHVDISELQLEGPIPEWVFDNHTLKGKMLGRTDLEMTISEQEALSPHQMGMFDNCGWQPYYCQEIGNGNITSEKEIEAIRKFQEGKPYK